MKVLWIVNTIFPYPAEKLGREKESFGGWLIGLADELKNSEEIELSIATVYNGSEILEFYDGKIKYYLIPGAPALEYNKELENYWREICSKFNPDLVHIHGSEFTLGLAFINACPNVKNVLSIQGLVSVYANVYTGNISNKDIIKNITFRDIIKKDNIFQQKKKFCDRGKYEIGLIKKVNNIIGRTDWDYANIKAINPNANYYLGNETLRSNFYNKEWNINNIDRHTIFASQAGYPIKGLHYALEALSILKEKYKDIKLYVAGNNLVDTSTLDKKIRLSGYANYLKRLIKKHHLEENIIFTGTLNEEQMVDRLLKTNVFILPSVIENSSNSLGEAMMLGMPCVASNTGGTMDMLEHKKEGLLYPYTEPAMLAEYISKYFEDDKLCIEYGKNARKTAIDRHDPNKNASRIVEIYNEIMRKNND